MLEKFVVLTEWYEAIKYLSDEQLGQLFRALFEYANDQTYLPDNEVMCPFMFIKGNFERMNIAYEDLRKKRSEAGKLGNLKRWGNKSKDEIKIANAICATTCDKNISQTSLININKDISIKETDINISKEKSQQVAPASKQKMDLEFIDSSFKEPMQLWLDYKRERKESYKSSKSIQVLYKTLLRLSDNDPNIAMKIIEQSIANNWAGLFELKNQNNNGSNQNYYPTATERARAELMQGLEDIRQKYASGRLGQG